MVLVLQFFVFFSLSRHRGNWMKNERIKFKTNNFNLTPNYRITNLKNVTA